MGAWAGAPLLAVDACGGDEASSGCVLRTVLVRSQADGLSVSVDPWSPPLPVWGIKEEADACGGTLALELGTLTHVVQVSLALSLARG